MSEYVSRRRVGVRKVQVHDLSHVRIHYDADYWLGMTNRGGIWNFGDGEIAVAYFMRPMDYEMPAGSPWRTHTRPRHTNPEEWKKQGIMLSRSFDNGETWPENERQWIWNNDRSYEEILDWLRPIDWREREQIDLAEPDSIIHFCHAEYLKYPFGGKPHPSLPASSNFHLGHLQHPPSFCLRSRDRGRTWESHASLIEGPSAEGGFLTVNLGHVRFDNGVLGIAGSTYWRSIACFYTSYDNGLTWGFTSEIARTSTQNPEQGYTYLGVHRLPDGRLLCSMHQMVQNIPCVAFSEDDGMTWSEPRPIVSPGTYACPLFNEEPDHALGDSVGPLYRSPRALVTRDGRILVLFARRRPVKGGMGILGVLSDDLGETWSEEFVIRGDAYTWDNGYPVVTELEDGRFFTAYWITTKDGVEPVHQNQCVCYIAGTSFKLD